MQHRTAIQSSMGIGEKPSQGELFAEFAGEGFREPLAKTRKTRCVDCARLDIWDVDKMGYCSDCHKGRGPR